MLEKSILFSRILLQRIQYAPIRFHLALLIGYFEKYLSCASGARKIRAETVLQFSGNGFRNSTQQNKPTRLYNEAQFRPNAYPLMGVETVRNQLLTSRASA